MKNKKIYIIIVVLAVIVLVASAGYIYYKKNYPKVKSIEIFEETLALVEDDIYTIDIDIKPKDAKNKKIIWSSQDKEVANVYEGKVTAISSGNTKICAKIDKTDIKDCVDVDVMSKKEKILSWFLFWGFKETIPNQKYVQTSSTSTYELDLLARTFTSTYKDDSVTFSYIYHYSQNYVEGYSNSGGATAEYFYNPDTNNLSCLGGNSIYHQYVCSYSSIESTKNSINTTIKLFKAYLGDYSIEDLY